jgi:hypothetical protein
MFEIGNMTTFISSPLVAWTILALTVVMLSGLALHARPPAFAPKPSRSRAAGTAMLRATPAAARESLDVTGQMDRLFAIISDCERRASRAARCHASAKAKLDQAEYHLAALLASDPLLERISNRAPAVALVATRVESSSRPDLRLAA